MSRKRIFIRGNNRAMVKVWWDSEWQEYVVKSYIDGVKQGSYHCSDKDDALGTAYKMLEEVENAVRKVKM